MSTPTEVYPYQMVSPDGNNKEQNAAFAHDLLHLGHGLEVTLGIERIAVPTKSRQS